MERDMVFKAHDRAQKLAEAERQKGGGGDNNVRKWLEEVRMKFPGEEESEFRIAGDLLAENDANGTTPAAPEAGEEDE